MAWNLKPSVLYVLSTSSANQVFLCSTGLSWPNKCYLGSVNDSELDKLAGLDEGASASSNAGAPTPSTGASIPALAPASISAFKYTEKVVQRVTGPASLTSTLVNHTWNATNSVSSVRTTLTPLVPLGPIVHPSPLHSFVVELAFVGTNTSVEPRLE